MRQSRGAVPRVCPCAVRQGCSAMSKSTNCKQALRDRVPARVFGLPVMLPLLSERISRAQISRCARVSRNLSSVVSPSLQNRLARSTNMIPVCIGSRFRQVVLQHGTQGRAQGFFGVHRSRPSLRVACSSTTSAVVPWRKFAHCCIRTRQCRSVSRGGCGIAAPYCPCIGDNAPHPRQVEPSATPKHPR